jgi:type 1 glutamine amidotransferase
MQRRELLRIAPAAALGWAASPLVRAAAGQTGKLLYFTRSAGFEHSVVQRKGGALSHSEKTLVEMGRQAGFEVECSKDGRVFDAGLDAFDVIAFYTTGDLTEKAPDGSPPMSAEGKKKLLEAIATGKGFVGIHSATDTFHSRGAQNENQAEVDPYIAMLGGEFLTHGAQQEASLILTSRFPGAGQLGMADGISFTDEWYTFKNFRPDLHVILVQETHMMQGDCYRRPNFPATWARRHGQGRVFYTSLGHREDVWTNPFFQTIALGGIAWAMGRVEFDLPPNLDQVTPQASQLKNVG